MPPRARSLVVTEARAPRVAAGVIATCAVATSLYALLRVVQKLSGSEPDPALVLYSAHAGYYWRAWTASYGGVMAGVITYVIAGRSLETVLRVLSTAVLVAAIAIAAQGILVP